MKASSFRGARARGLRERSDSQEEVTSLEFSPMSETIVGHHPTLSPSSTAFTRMRLVPERITLRQGPSPAAKRSDGAVERVGVHVHGHPVCQVLQEDTHIQSGGDAPASMWTRSSSATLTFRGMS